MRVSGGQGLVLRVTERFASEVCSEVVEFTLEAFEVRCGAVRRTVD